MSQPAKLNKESKKKQKKPKEELRVNNTIVNRSNVKVIGDRNRINGAGCDVLGDENTINANAEEVRGTGNTVNGDVETLIGNNNRVYGIAKNVRGNQNNVTGCSGGGTGGRRILYGIGYQGPGVVNNIHGFEFITQDPGSSISVSSSGTTITTPYVQVTKRPGGVTVFNWSDDSSGRTLDVHGSNCNVVGSAAGVVHQTITADGVTQTVRVGAPATAISSSSSSKRKVEDPPPSAKRIKAPVPPAIEDEPSAVAGETVCIVCIDRAVKTVNAPCGHACLCVTCARKLADESKFCCPLCKVELKRIKRMFIDPSCKERCKDIITNVF